MSARALRRWEIDEDDDYIRRIDKPGFSDSQEFAGIVHRSAVLGHAWVWSAYRYEPRGGFSTRIGSAATDFADDPETAMRDCDAALRRIGWVFSDDTVATEDEVAELLRLAEALP